MRHPGKTHPFRDTHGAPVPGSIAEIAYLRLGGLDQWVMMRGQSVANPPLIHLHGGPGFSEMRLFRHFNAPLEESFTVVSWDQRGAGKSFDPAIPRSSMTAGQLVADLDDLVEAVRARLGKSKVVLFGHSWGSALGVLYAARFPEKVAAYVGCGQIGDWPAAETASYAYAIDLAERSGNRRALKALHRIGPPPYSPRQIWVARTWLQRLEGRRGVGAMWRLMRMALGGPEASVLDLPSLVRGFRFSIDAMWTDVSKLNLLKEVPELKMPVFFFLGRHDHWVPVEMSVAYFETMRAPSKQIVWFEESGHEPFVDEAERFNEAIVKRVRPVAG